MILTGSKQNRNPRDKHAMEEEYCRNQLPELRSRLSKEKQSKRKRIANQVSIRRVEKRLGNSLSITATNATKTLNVVKLLVAI